MPTISKDNKVATSIVVFTVEPGNQQKVVDMLVETTEKAMKHIAGFCFGEHSQESRWSARR